MLCFSTLCNAHKRVGGPFDCTRRCVKQSTGCRLESMFQGSMRCPKKCFEDLLTVHDGVLSSQQGVMHGFIEHVADLQLAAVHQGVLSSCRAGTAGHMQG
eukprot:jgi/Chrzof1/1484/Cz10g09170.t1